MSLPVSLLPIEDDRASGSPPRRFAPHTWLANCKDVCMESTGKSVYNILEHTCNIELHPKYVKAIRGKKTDKRDAK